ncbi:MAG: bifunctional lysine ketoglutarate reductase /saccharopine dehydrogenase family protein [Candidatus Marinimicrobia bacterium]|nr:bifunctional lysine ketoglutarate reductase /saccharopine dehydrogenase family protein [Candidatus Neomarinimicrobiota bacterium]
MIFGIRREDKNEWEARVPLTPSQVEALTGNYPVKFIVQPSPIRAFPDEDYLQAGAQISEDLDSCDVILAVKEIPSELLLPGKIYLFFSHTVKGQEYNQPMLKRLVELRATLIDYERIVDDAGKRLVFFGRYAGIAGMIDTLWALGQRLKLEGYQMPLAEVKQAWRYSDLENAKESIRAVGEQIRNNELPANVTPLVVGFTGYGNVSGGAQEIFDLLPCCELRPSDLAQFYKSADFSNNFLYKVVFKEGDMFQVKDRRRKFDLQEYFRQPENYESRFEEYIPYLTVLVNAIYWDNRYPKLVTRKFLKSAYQRGQPDFLKVIGDITCDIEGSIECNLATTTPGDPVYVYDPLAETIQMGFAGKGPVILAVDNLPSELPRDSSTMFGAVLSEFIPRLAVTDFSQPFTSLNLPPELKRATILHKGKFTPDYQYMTEYIRE